MSKFFLLFIIATISFSGCGSREKEMRSPNQEAYRLMDHGHNAKAIRILEKELVKNPNNDEARVLLGSAYVGLAGINVYSLYDLFKDLLFKRSLKDSLIEGKGNDPLASAFKIANVEEQTRTPLEKFIRNVDHVLVDVQATANYLDRFPRVEESKWAYLETALTHLDQAEPSSDLSVYRMFVRLIYLRSYLVTKLVEDDGLGTRIWACNFKLKGLKANMEVVDPMVFAIVRDLEQGIDLGAKKLVKARDGLALLSDSMHILRSMSEMGDSIAIAEVEGQIRDAFKCR